MLARSTHRYSAQRAQGMTDKPRDRVSEKERKIEKDENKGPPLGQCKV